MESRHGQLARKTKVNLKQLKTQRKELCLTTKSQAGLFIENEKQTKIQQVLSIAWTRQSMSLK